MLQKIVSSHILNSFLKVPNLKDLIPLICRKVIKEPVITNWTVYPGNINLEDIEYLKIPINKKYLHRMMFFNLKNLKAIYFEESTTGYREVRVDGAAFKKCRNLISVYGKNTILIFDHEGKQFEKCSIKVFEPLISSSKNNIYLSHFSHNSQKIPREIRIVTYENKKNTTLKLNNKNINFKRVYTTSRWQEVPESGIIVTECMWSKSPLKCYTLETTTIHISGNSNYQKKEVILDKTENVSAMGIYKIRTVIANNPNLYYYDLTPLFPDKKSICFGSSHEAFAPKRIVVILDDKEIKDLLEFIKNNHIHKS